MKRRSEVNRDNGVRRYLCCAIALLASGVVLFGGQHSALAQSAEKPKGDQTAADLERKLQRRSFVVGRGWEYKSPRTLVVPDQYPSIQAAINAANVFDDVLVRAGTYRESITLKAGVHLRGEKAGDVQIEAPDTASAAVINGSGCRSGAIENLAVNGRNVGTTDAPVHGVLLLDSSLSVQSCTFHNCTGVGLFVRGRTAKPTLIGNRIWANRQFGIYFDKEASGLAERNIVEQNGWDGIVVFGAGTSPTLKNNQIKTNKHNGIFFGKSATGVAEGNTCEENEQVGIGVRGEGTKPTLRANRCVTNKQYGIYFDQGAAGLAEGNTCEGNEQVGIFVRGEGTKPTLRANRCVANKQYGVYFDQGAAGLAERNTVEQNAWGGIGVFDAGTSPTLKNNQINANQGEWRGVVEPNNAMPLEGHVRRFLASAQPTLKTAQDAATLSNQLRAYAQDDPAGAMQLLRRTLIGLGHFDAQSLLNFYQFGMKQALAGPCHDTGVFGSNDDAPQYLSEGLGHLRGALQAAQDERWNDAADAFWKASVSVHGLSVSQCYPAQSQVLYAALLTSNAAASAAAGKFAYAADGCARAAGECNWSNGQASIRTLANLIHGLRGSPIEHYSNPTPFPPGSLPTYGPIQSMFDSTMSNMMWTYTPPPPP